MIFCKRCGSITINDICYNCSGSNLFSHLPLNMPANLELNFFSPTSEMEKKIRWNSQLEERENLTTKVQATPPEKKGIGRIIGNIGSLKHKQRNIFLDFKRVNEEHEIEKERKTLDPVENLLNTHPLIKKRMEWRKRIEKSSSITSDLKKLKLPPKVDFNKKPDLIKQKKDKNTEIYQIN
ncbi:MAG: hypothetical protein ACFFCM_00305 [Promethearchaeota archaeon]